jgi:hypothetical protein
MKIFGKGFDLRDLLQTAIFGGSAGSGMLLAYELISKQPAMVIETFRSWGPLSLFCLIGLVMVDRGFRSIVGATEQSAAAQQKLADAVNMIAVKDDREKEEQRRLLSYVGSQQETIIRRMDEIATQLKGQARGASA